VRAAAAVDESAGVAKRRLPKSGVELTLERR
jgi:hypothetical protein